MPHGVREAMLSGLPQLIRYKTGYDVRVGYPNQFLVAGSDAGITQPQYATGIGLIVEGSFGGVTAGSRQGCSRPVCQRKRSRRLRVRPSVP